MDNLKQLTKSILEQGYLMSLGTQDEGGVWVCDVIYIHDDDFNIYWMSDPDVRHSKAILVDSKVAATITVSNRAGEPNVGLQIEGQAEKIEGDDLTLGAKHAAKRNKPAPTKEGEILEGDSWYKLKPAKIEIIYEPLYGFEKKVIEF